MRALASANQTALEKGLLIARDFLWIEAREFGSGDPVTQGFWSGVSDVSAQVLNPQTGLATTRTFYGAGSLIQISAVPLVANGTVQSVTVNMSQLHEIVEEAVRGYDCKQARVEMYRGLFNTATRDLVAPAFCRFFGFVDTIEIETPPEGDTGAVILNCKSHSQEFTRSNPDTRTVASQVRRSNTDNFHQTTGVAGDWEIWWGTKKGKVAAK